MSTLPTAVGSLWVRTFGDLPAPVVALHGFTLHGGMFARLAEELATGVRAPDLPGHGRTEIEPITTVAAVTAVADLLEKSATPPVLVGYSQGGRVALRIAISHPQLIGALVLVSSSTGLSEKARVVRGAADDALATRIEKIGLDRFIDEWLVNPITATDNVPPTVRAADRAMRLENTAAGLAAALRGMGQASVPDSSAQLAALPLPVVAIAGERDIHYADTATAMMASRGQRPVIVPGVGHNVILEAPAAVAAEIRPLLNQRSA